MSNISCIKQRSCPSCGGAEAHILHSVAAWRVVACSNCDFVYLNVEAAPEFFEQGAGAWETSIKDTHARRRREAPITTSLSLATRFRTKLRQRTPVDFIEASLPSRSAGKRSVLDIGCGAGDYLSSLDTRYTPFGIELSRGLAERAQQAFSARGGFVMNEATVNALPRFGRGSIDAVVVRSYLEHEPRPREVLEGVRNVLRDGGVAVVKVPNYASLNRRVMRERWCGFRFPEHVNYFTPQSLRRMAQHVGLGFEQRMRDRLPTNDNMWAILRKS